LSHPVIWSSAINPDPDEPAVPLRDSIQLGRSNLWILRPTNSHRDASVRDDEKDFRLKQLGQLLITGSPVNCPRNLLANFPNIIGVEAGNRDSLGGTLLVEIQH
jgi:hypothetical protein